MRGFNCGNDRALGLLFVSLAVTERLVVGDGQNNYHGETVTLHKKAFFVVMDPANDAAEITL